MLRRYGADPPFPGKVPIMDLNLVVLCGRLAAPAEIRQFESGSRLARYLVTVRSEEPPAASTWCR